MGLVKCIDVSSKCVCSRRADQRKKIERSWGPSSKRKGTSAFAQGPFLLGPKLTCQLGSFRLISSTPAGSWGCFMASIRLIATVSPVTLSSVPDKVLP